MAPIWVYCVSLDSSANEGIQNDECRFGCRDYGKRLPFTTKTRGANRLEHEAVHGGGRGLPMRHTFLYDDLMYAAAGYVIL